MATRIKKGTRFRAEYRDSNPEWEVVRSRGRGVWEARVVNSEDWNGAVACYMTEQIQHSLRLAEFFARNHAEHIEFYEGLALGTVIHYHNGFGEFVRCEVVLGSVSGHGSKKVLKPTALVGSWNKYHAEYYITILREGRVFAPNVGNLYEAGGPDPRHHPDPRGQLALDISQLARAV